MTRRSFDDSLLEAVDFAFYSLGKSCRRSLYYYLKKSFHMERSEIPERVKEFDDALRMIFRDGAVFLEKLILENLCKTLNVKINKNHSTGFVETVSKIKNMVSEKEHVLSFSGFDEKMVTAKWKRRSAESSKSKRTPL